MDLTETQQLYLLEKLLGVQVSHSTKSAISALIIKDEPLTTRKLNAILNKSYTYGDYLKTFELPIDRGVVEIVEVRYEGIKRKAFKLNIDKAKEYISNNLE